jgi:hypothetical protein
VDAAAGGCRAVSVHGVVAVRLTRW